MDEFWDSWSSSGGEGSNWLLNIHVSIVFFDFLLTGALLSFAALTFAQSQPKGEAVFVGVKKADRVGKFSAQPDGKPDAVFTLSLKPSPGDSPISEIEIRTIAGPPGVWSSAKTAPEGYLGVAKAKKPSEIIQQSAWTDNN